MVVLRAWLRQEAAKKPNLFTRALSECFCTCFMVFIGLGAMASAVLQRSEFGLDVQLAWALSLAVTVAMGVRISGANINPAISFMFFVQGHMSPLCFLVYSLAQTLGAFLAAALTFGVYYDGINHFDNGTRQLFGPQGTGLIFTSFPQPYLSVVGGLVDQTANTALLCLCVKAVVDRNTAIPYYLHSLFIGFGVFVIAASYSLNGMGSMNPARDLGPRLFLLAAGYPKESFSHNHYKWFWIPVIGPLIGAVVGAWAYDWGIGKHIPSLPPEIDPNRGQATMDPGNRIQKVPDEADPEPLSAHATEIEHSQHFKDDFSS